MKEISTQRYRCALLLKWNTRNDLENDKATIFRTNKSMYTPLVYLNEDSLLSRSCCRWLQCACILAVECCDRLEEIVADDLCQTNSLKHLQITFTCGYKQKIQSCSSWRLYESVTCLFPCQSLRDACCVTVSYNLEWTGAESILGGEVSQAYHEVVIVQCENQEIELLFFCFFLKYKLWFIFRVSDLPHSR